MLRGHGRRRIHFRQHANRVAGGVRSLLLKKGDLYVPPRTRSARMQADAKRKRSAEYACAAFPDCHTRHPESYLSLLEKCAGSEARLVRQAGTRGHNPRPLLCAGRGAILWPGISKGPRGPHAGRDRAAPFSNCCRSCLELDGRIIRGSAADSPCASRCMNTTVRPTPGSPNYTSRPSVVMQRSCAAWLAEPANVVLSRPRPSSRSSLDRAAIHDFAARVIGVGSRLWNHAHVWR